MLPGYSITVRVQAPAVAGMVHTVAEQREYRRHADRYGNVAAELRLIRRDMRSADSQDLICAIGREAAKRAVTENADWYSVMRYHEIELA